jgi:hypothetical protein
MRREQGPERTVMDRLTGRVKVMLLGKWKSRTGSVCCLGQHLGSS